MLSAQKIVELLQAHFPHFPTNDQRDLFAVFANFFTYQEGDKLLVLKGYAGTGKTTFVRAVVKALENTTYKSMLMAPTGRSAKVMSQYAQKPAFTIHKKIYYTTSGKGGQFSLKKKANKYKRCLFIVDEASMIGDEQSGSSLLEDLMQYVYSGTDCALMLIGDPAQLPPVGLSQSPALSEEALQFYGHFKLFSHSLQSVMRQHEQSGILKNANALRQKLMAQDFLPPFFNVMGLHEVVKVEGSEMQELLQEAISTYGLENTLVVCRSNKRAVLYNQAIRQRLLYKENTLESGELLMVVKNNYYYASSDDDFVANGEILEIQQIIKYHHFYGFHFAEAEVCLVDTAEPSTFTAILLLDTLESHTASLTQDEHQRLWEEIGKDYAHIGNKRKRYQAIKNDKFYNAIQVKYAYALTCHKTQGGQWDAIFIDYPWLPPNAAIDTDYMRWLYTACTRAVQKLYLVNFKDSFFEG